MTGADTIFALSSGQPPAAVAVLRISGPKAGHALKTLAGNLPEPRVARVVKLTKSDSVELLDHALCLWFPGPASATGEDLTEIQCHGGRAVVAVIETELSSIPGLRKAEPGEFTRRAFQNGKMDLAEAEGLSDLLFAETEIQRRAAMQMADGGLSKDIARWQSKILELSAAVEAELDFSDEDDVHPAQLDKIISRSKAIADDIAILLARPRAEKLREGLRVVLGGPPNSGKSTLLNALTQREAAIVSDIAGTTRDVIEVPVAISGIPFLLIDTAGVRDDGAEKIEQIGIARARDQFALADIILWLGGEGEGPDRASVIEVAARADHPEFIPKSRAALAVSPISGNGMDKLMGLLLQMAQTLLPTGNETIVNARQAELLNKATANLSDIANYSDFLIIAEQLRGALRALDALTGRAGTEDMLDTLFGGFCIGK